MPDSAEHRVVCYRLSQEQRAQGRPSWERTIRLADVWRNEEMTFEQRRDVIAARIKASPWYKSRDRYYEIRDEFDELALAVEGLEEAEDSDEFDGWWDEIYDIADGDRVWIAIR